MTPTTDLSGAGKFRFGLSSVRVAASAEREGSSGVILMALPVLHVRAYQWIANLYFDDSRWDVQRSKLHRASVQLHLGQSLSAPVPVQTLDAMSLIRWQLAAPGSVTEFHRQQLKRKMNYELRSPNNLFILRPAPA